MSILDLLVLVQLPFGLLLVIRAVRRDPGVLFVRCAPRLDGVRRSLYSSLRRARADLFADSPGVRLTLLMPDEEDPGALRPVLRFGWGQPSDASAARFRPGEGLAGRAWSEPGALLVARLPRDVPPSRMRDLHRELFALNGSSAARLSDDMLRVQALLACTVTDPTGSLRGVLCIDCLDASLVPDETQQDEATSRWYRDVRRIAANVGRLVEPVKDRNRAPALAMRTVEESKDRTASVASLEFVGEAPLP
jgi:hypothetical protein